jgi:threonine/homoserine/homoserine lactone efflux protein
MEALAVIGAIAGVQVAAVISPGPNFLLVSGQAMSASRGASLCVVAGIVAGTLVWSTLAVSGLGVLISQFPAVATTVRFVAAVYLIWLGARLVIVALRQRDESVASMPVASGSTAELVWLGFLTNMTNPKSLAYYTSLFVVVLPVEAPAWLFAAAVATAFAVSATWWTGVALFFGSARVRRVYARARRVLDVIFGLAMAGLGARLIVSGR